MLPNRLRWTVLGAALFLFLLIPSLFSEGDDNNRTLENRRTALQSITPEELRQHVAYLASDELEGRASGEPGLRMAAAYLAAYLETYGLKPAGDDGTYFQKFRVSGKKSAHNVLGLLEGSDPELKGEFVVVGAHYDHLGRGSGAESWLDLLRGGSREDPDDDLYNGADDNASGTAAVLEIAEAFATTGLRPRRSILFMFFGAEELGLIGSGYYVKHPLLPLDRTVAMINFDMVGRNPRSPIQLMAADSSPEIRESFEEAASELGLRIRFDSGFFSGGSDHQSFYSKGIPVAHLFTGIHRDYHGPNDEVERISVRQMQRAAQLGFVAVADIANAPGRPTFKKLPTFDWTRFFGGDSKRRLFGITTEAADLQSLRELGFPELKGGVAVSSIQPSSTAEACGIELGDVIVAFNGTPVEGTGRRALSQLRSLVKKAPANRDFPVEVIREDQKLELTARFEEKD